MHSVELLVHSIGIVFAVTAAVLALRLIRLTGALKAWLFIASGLVLLAVVSFDQLIFHSGIAGGKLELLHPALIDIASVASYALLLAGVIASRTVFLERKAGLELLQAQLDRMRRTSPEAEAAMAPGESAVRQALLTPGKAGLQVLPALEYMKVEQQRAAQTLQEWQAAFDTVSTPIFLYDRQYRLIRANPAYASRAGMAVKDLLGKPYFEIFPKLPSPIIDPPQYSQQGVVSSELTLATGEAFISKSLPLYNEANEYRCSLHILEEVTQARQAEKSIRRFKLALKVVSACVREIPQKKDRAQMLQAICKVAVNSGFYRLAWIGRVQNDAAQTLEILASHGQPADLTPLQITTWADTEASRTPSTVAINSRKTCLAQDLLHDPQFRSCHRHAAKHHLASAVALPLFRQNDIWGCLTLYSDEPFAFSNEEITVLDILGSGISFGITAFREMAENTAQLQEYAQRLSSLKTHLEKIIVALETAIEARRPYGSAHQRLVGEIGMAIAQEMGLPEEQAYGVRLAGILHDVGEIKLPEELLCKTGGLTEEERLQIRQHTQAGYEVLSGIDLPWPLAQTVLQHHERMNGSGYPSGLTGGNILLEAKIIAVADTIEAMAYQRHDHPRMGLPAALAEVEKGKGTLFDTAVVDAAIGLFREKGYQPS